MSYEDDVLDCMNDISKCHTRLKKLVKLHPDFMHAASQLEITAYLVEMGMDALAIMSREYDTEPEPEPDVTIELDQ